MARVGGVYFKPSNTEAVAGQVISPTAYESRLQEIENDLNVDRPLIAGGTGASNAADARTNLELGGKWKLNATTAPATDDDTGDLYSVGSIWCDVTNDLGYICLDPSTSAAVWLRFVTEDASGDASVSNDLNVVNDLDVGGQIAFANRLNPTTLVIADDAATSLDFGEDVFGGQLFISTNNNASNGVMWWFRAASSPDLVKLTTNAAFEEGSGVLTGTTGNDGVVTVSVTAGGVIYIENRLGASRNFYAAIIG